MSFSDTIFLFLLALVLFGPKKLPEMARLAGKWLAELRRASNEFRSQIESEIAHLEVQKQRTSSVSSSTTAPASMAASAAIESTVPREKSAPATLAAPMQVADSAGPSDAILPEPLSVASSDPSAAVSTDPATPSDPLISDNVPAPQESHV